MPVYVAFLRAVNVGKRQTQMARVRSSLEVAGFTGVQTHIQTGNVLVSTPSPRADEVAGRVSELLSAEFGFEVPAIVRRPEELSELVAHIGALPDPFPLGRTYAAFLSAPLSAEAAAAFVGWDVPGEWPRVVGPHVVLRRAPDHELILTGARIERGGVLATVRDLRVVTAIVKRWCD